MPTYPPPPPAHAAPPRAPDPSGRHRGRDGEQGATSMRRGARGAGMVVVALVSVGVLVAAGYFWYTARGINDAGKRLNVAVGRGSAKTDIDGKAQNILLVGNDDRTNMTAAEVKSLHVGRDGGSMATDTMMIVHVPADGSKATLISLPRDSYVSIPGLGGDGKDKLNSAYVYGYNENSKAPVNERETNGINLLLETVRNLTGLTIDHYIQVSLLGFVRISNAIGGVPIDLCENVDDTVSHNAAEGGSGGSGFKMTKGSHTIEGIKALEFVRQRHNFPGDAEDLDRVKRQQYFLTSAFRQVAKAGVVTKLTAIKNALTTSITADRSLQLFSLAHQMADLSANNIVGKTIPTKNGTSNTGQDVLVVDPAKVKTFIDKLINPPKTAPSTGAPTSSTSAKAGGTTAKAPSQAIDSKCVN